MVEEKLIKPEVQDGEADREMDMVMQDVVEKVEEEVLGKSQNSQDIEAVEILREEKVLVQIQRSVWSR